MTSNPSDIHPAKIAVFGAGAWGTALAIQLDRNGVKTSLWGRCPEQMEAMQKTHRNERYLKDVDIPKTLNCTCDAEALVKSHRDLLMVVPSQVFRTVIQQLKPHMDSDTRVIWATKGLELKSGDFLHDVLEQELGKDTPTAIVSGPSFATELSVGLPTVMTAASRSEEFLADVVDYFHGGNLRIYTSDDVLGVEVGGAIKNVLAIATGISDGMGFGANTRAAIITRGLAEMMRFGEAIGANRETLMGPSGVGDLVLTCTDDQSRNRRLGLALGQGKSLDVATAEIGQALEGVKTAGVITAVAKKAGVEMPISQMVYEILYKDRSIKTAVTDLLERKLRSEN